MCATRLYSFANVSLIRIDDTYRQGVRRGLAMAAYTSKDVARVAGVSQSTVSYVLTGNRPISEQTRRRVLDAIEQLTYQPNAGARALAKPRARGVGVGLPVGVLGGTA